MTKPTEREHGIHEGIENAIGAINDFEATGLPETTNTRIFLHALRDVIRQAYPQSIKEMD